MLSWLSAKGTVAIIEFSGILYRGWAKQKIKKYILDNNFVDIVIWLPSDLFLVLQSLYVSLFLKKNKTDNSILSVDFSNEFVRNTNKVSDENINNFIELITNR